MSDGGAQATPCAKCGEIIEFPAETRVSCPHCGAEVVPGAGAQATQPAAEEISAAELKEALDKTVPRRSISVFYQFGLLLVALFMVLLPLVYLACVGAVAWCTYWYAINAKEIFTSSGGGIAMKIVLYVGPTLGGAIAVFFMFKPILARRPKQAQSMELNPAQHPRLYQFIAHISDALGVAMPKTIYLNCELNASAGFRRGWLSLLGSDLEMTIGLPLASGLDTRQLAAVVAHELGHCTQTSAMRLNYVISRINGWFFRVVYERDAWDETILGWQRSSKPWWLALIVLCITCAVWLSRQVLRGLMLTGHFASCFLLRQMEYHADSCAIEVAGPAGLESLLLRLRERAVLERIAYANLEQMWKQRHQLPDCLPEFLDELERRLPPDFHEQARLTLINERGSWYATHPTDAQRIQKARATAGEGIFDLEKPARALFNNFVHTAHLVTGAHYRENLRLPIGNNMLKPAREFFQEARAETRRIPLG